MAAEPVAALAGVRESVLGRRLALGPGPGAARPDQEGFVAGRGAVFARERLAPRLAEMGDARRIERIGRERGSDDAAADQRGGRDRSRPDKGASFDARGDSPARLQI
jgi:hypothetical protein